MKDLLQKKWFKAFSVFVGVVIIAVLFFYSGVSYATRGRVGFTASVAPINPLGADFALFWDSYSLLRENYVSPGKLDSKELIYGSIKGMVDAIGDPYTVFFEPQDATKFREDIEGSFGGVGAEIGIRNKQLVIISPLKGNPAYEAGLKAGDRILKVDDLVISTEMTVEEAVSVIRGEPGTNVSLLIYREGWTEPKEYEIVRRVISVPTLDWEMKGDGIAYVRMYSFNANLPDLFATEASRMTAQGMKGMILDLRNNPGGFLEVVNELGGWFAESGSLMMTERFQSGESRELRVSGNGKFKNLPMVVLINEGSASASEILAGMLRDVRGVKLVGAKTFGKGSVQDLKDLKDGSSLKVTIAEWYTPNGTVINEKGLEPDIAVTSTDVFASSSESQQIDVQFDKALEHLILKMAGE